MGGGKDDCELEAPSARFANTAAVGRTRAATTYGRDCCKPGAEAAFVSDARGARLADDTEFDFGVGMANAEVDNEVRLPAAGTDAAGAGDTLGPSGGCGMDSIMLGQLPACEGAGSVWAGGTADRGKGTAVGDSTASDTDRIPLPAGEEAVRGNAAATAFAAVPVVTATASATLTATPAAAHAGCGDSAREDESHGTVTGLVTRSGRVRGDGDADADTPTSCVLALASCALTLTSCMLSAREACSADGWWAFDDALDNPTLSDSAEPTGS